MRESRVLVPSLVLAMSVLATSVLALAATSVLALQEGDGLSKVDAKAFTLERDVAGDARRASALAALGLRKVPLADVVADGNRDGRRVKSVAGVQKLHLGFAWNDGDDDTAEWFPQGVAGAVVGTRKVVAVSWYDKVSSRGVRISFADVTNLDKVTYRHVLLVEPVKKAGRVEIRPVKVHAGGIAIVGPLLYVVDTFHGFRIFDTREIREVSATQAFNYKYVLPQASEWTLATGSKKAIFSSVALDRSTSPPSLVTAEYHGRDIKGRVFRWKLDAKGRLAATGKSLHPSEAYVTSQDRVQGVASFKGKWFLSCSSQKGARGSLYVTEPGKKSKERSWSHGAESLHVSASGNLWSVTEHRGNRRVFAVKVADYD